MSAGKLFFALLVTVSLHGAAPWPLPLFTADPRAVIAAASKYPAPEGSDGITIDYSVRAQLDQIGRLHQTRYSVTKVLRVQGIESARRIVASWIPWRENRPTVKIRVITSDGVPHVLTDTSLSESTAPNANGVQVLSAFLADVEVDSIVEVEIEKSDREPGYPGGRSGEIVLDSKFPTLRFQVLVEAPAEPELRVRTEGIGTVKRTDSAKPAGRQVVIEASNVPPVESGAFLPPEVKAFPTITFSNLPSWQALAQWYAGLFAKFLPSQKVTHSVVSSGPVSNVETAFEELRAHVRDNSSDLGADPYAPHSPAETLAKGAADSRDEAALLISKLNELGIPAQAALVSAAPHPDLVPELPELEAFNHVLVYVPGQHPLWIDPGAEFTPVSRLPIADQGRWALIVDPSTANLVRTPASGASENRQIQTTEIRLRDGGDPTITTVIEASGAFEDSLRPGLHEFAVAGKEDQDQLRMRFGRLTRAQRVTKIDVGEPNQLLKPCRVRIEGDGYAAARVGDEMAFIDLPGPAALAVQRVASLLRSDAPEAGSIFAAGSRKDDYYLPPAFAEEDRYHVIPPPGYKLKPPSPVPSINIGPLSVKTSIKSETDGSLSVGYSFTNPKTRYTVQEVAAIRSDAAKLERTGAVGIVFANVAEEKLASGELKEGIALLRQAAASDPANANAALRLANAYLDVGASSEAVRICRDVLSKNKENAAAYAHLGWIYAHDEFGRALRPGINIPEAENAYSKAIDLDPDQPLYALQLATLYTYGTAGIRFGASANLEAALKMYRRLGLDVLAGSGALNDYAATMLFARKYDEIRQFFLYPQAERAEPAIKLAAIAATAGANDVSEEANYLFPVANTRRIQLIEAARYLLNSRDYSPAVMLFQNAGAALQTSMGVDLESLRRTRMMDESALSKQPAIAALQRFIVATLNPSDPNAWANLLVPEARKIPVEKYRRNLFQIVPALQTLLQQVVAWPWVADLMATSTNFTVDGNEQTGYRIRVPDPSLKSMLKTIAYVVNRGNEYLILGFAGSAQSSGEALQKVESGDLASARLWLDWAKEEQGPVNAADPMSIPAFAVLWPTKSGEPLQIKAAAAAVAARGTEYAHGIKALAEIREQINDPGLQTAVDQALAQGLLRNGQYSGAIPVLRRLTSKWQNSETIRYALAQALIYSDQFTEAAAVFDTSSQTEAGSLGWMRVRENLLTQQQKFKEAALLQAQICANPKSSASDWNSLAWLGFFSGSDTKASLEAAEKADQLTQSRNPDVLHTLALAQAANGDLKDARATAYRLMDGVGDSDELFTVFGRIAEQLELREVAAQYYERVKKPELNSPVSLYAFARMRVQNLTSSAPAPSRPKNLKE